MANQLLGTVVVTHSQPRLARNCLASLAGVVTPELTVVVVNCPDDSDPVALRSLSEYGALIANEHLRGYGENLNSGVQSLTAAAEYILLLNDDLVFSPGAVESLVAALASDPSAGLAAPNIVDPLGAPQPAVFAFPSIGSEVVQAALLPARIARTLRARHASIAAPGPPRRVQWVLGAAMLVRRRAFDDVGGFDSGYFLYSEETDLCRRLHDHGWSVLSCGDAVVTHLAGASTSEMRFSRMLGRSRARYLRRNLSHGQQLALAAALMAVQVWNVAYVGMRVLLAPSSATAKLNLLSRHWHSRTLFQRPEGR